jgi:hypothetical protein
VLSQLGTNRLVVFLDACHAGAMAEEIKDAGWPQYDPASLVSEQAKQSRHVVASCGAGQLSREGDGNGIFTRHLLDLLRFKRPEDFDNESVDLWDLYSVLKQKVFTTVHDRFGGAVQEPYTNLDRRTGIVIAINSRLRDARVERERRFFETVCAEILRQGGNQVDLIVLKLEQIVDGYDMPPELERFGRVFRQLAADWTPGDAARVVQCCKDLIFVYGKGTGQSVHRQSSLAPAAPREGEAGIIAPAATNEPFAPGPAPGQDDRYSPSDAKKVILGDRVAIARPAFATQSPEERRGLSPLDCKYVREPIWDPVYLDVARRLNELLSQPGGVSEEDVKSWLLETQPADADARASWNAAAKDVWNRFQERWAHAETVRLQSALSLRTGAGNV